jgi:hypothetical protein
VIYDARSARRRYTYRYSHHGRIHGALRATWCNFVVGKIAIFYRTAIVLPAEKPGPQAIAMFMFSAGWL